VDDLDRLCSALARRRLTERVLGRVLPLAAIAGVAGATAVAVVRLAVPDAGWLVPALAASAFLAPLAVLPTALRRRDPAWLLAGHVDRLAGADGLAACLATTTTRDPAWSERLRPLLQRVVLPPMRLPALLPALAAGVLLVGAWFLPQASAPPPIPPVAGGTVRGAEERVAELAAERLAPPETVADLQQRLQAVREALAAQGLNQQTWAALDALERDLAAAKAQAGDRLGDALHKAEALAGLAADAGPEAAARAAADFAAALAELERAAPGLAAKLPAGAEGEALMRLAEQALAGGELTEAQRQALQRWGLDPAKAQAGGGQAGDAAAARQLADRLATELAMRGGMGGGEEQDGPGGGGPGPGGGHAALNWGDIQRIEGGFRDRLEAGTPLNPEAGARVGTQARAVREDELANETTARAATIDQAPAEADARRARVSPRHRTAVGGYFEAPSR
jgi:hypothetical protein